MDISDTIVARSDQLNAEDLVGGAITVQITGVKRTSDEQPVSVEISGGHKPWKPCKSMRRLLIMAWPDGAKKEGGETKYDPTCWIGRSVTLIRDPSVKWAGELVGGIRVSALSHIKAKFEVALAESKKKKKLVTVEKLDAPAGTKSEPPKQEPKPDATAANPIAARHSSICKAWKERRIKRGERTAMDDIRAFFVAATENCVVAENALKTEVFSTEVLDKVEEFLNFEMPE